MVSPKLSPYAYADNWSWISQDFREHFRAMQKVFNFVAALAMDIDYDKSWVWGATRTWRKQCQLLNSLFPSGEIQFDIRDSAKDLGIEIHYNKQTKLGSIADRIREGISRCEKLRWIPCDISQKSTIIQTGVWPAALHSADTQIVGDKLWGKLRRAATTALVGNHRNACSYLACTVLSTNIQDPLLYNICQMLRSIRRCAFLFPEFATEITKCAFDFDEKTVYGPAGALKRYLNKIGWHFATHQHLTGPGGFNIDIFNDSPKEIQKTLTSAWSYFVKMQIQHRKGIEHHELDLSLTAKVYRSITRVEQSIIALNLTGGYQTGAVKTVWTDDDDGSCPFRSQPDSRYHRILECPRFNDIRNRHISAIEILSTQRQEWIYLPIARKFQHEELLMVTHNNRRFPNHQEYHIPQPPQDESERLKFFTDGSCMFPTNDKARIAGWAVIQDTSQPNDQFSQIVQNHNCCPDKIPELQCVATGVVTKKQSAARAELSALAFICECVNKRYPENSADFYTDAQYVCNTIETIQQSPCIPLHHKMSNFDIVQKLVNNWNSEKYRVHKVKAHRAITDAKDSDDLWKIMANSCADLAASCAVKSVDAALLQTAREAEDFAKQEQKKLLDVFKFLVDLNVHQMKCLQENQKNNLLHLHSADGSVPCSNLVDNNSGNTDTNLSSFDVATTHLVNWL